MNKNEPVPTPKAIEQAIPKAGIPSRWKIVLAFFLGLLSILLLFFLGEVFGEHVMFPGMGAYFLIMQYFLSHSNPQAVRKDWPLILVLTLPLILSAIIVVIVEPSRGAKLSMLCVTLLAIACSYAGAVLAARTARH